MDGTVTVETAGGVSKVGGFGFPAADGAHLELQGSDTITITSTVDGDRTQTILQQGQTPALRVYVNDVLVYP